MDSQPQHHMLLEDTPKLYLPPSLCFSLRYNLHNSKFIVLNYVHRVVPSLSVPAHFHCPTNKPRIHQASLPFPFIPFFWRPLIYSTLVSMDLPILGIPHKWNDTVCGLCVWLLSLSIKFSKFIHVVPCVRFPSFLRLNNSSLYGETTACLHFHPLTDIWVTVQFLAIKNNAARIIFFCEFLGDHTLSVFPSPFQLLYGLRSHV